MGYTHTHYYETIIQRQIRAGRASNKSQGKERNEDDGPNSELDLRISFGVRLSVFGVLCGFAVPPSPLHL
jgi:hypothetical protein